MCLAARDVCLAARDVLATRACFYHTAVRCLFVSAVSFRGRGPQNLRELLRKTVRERNKSCDPLRTGHGSLKSIYTNPCFKSFLNVISANSVLSM